MTTLTGAQIESLEMNSSNCSPIVLTKETGTITFQFLDDAQEVANALQILSLYSIHDEGWDDEYNEASLEIPMALIQENLYQLALIFRIEADEV
jgi:hypothetical protein